MASEYILFFLGKYWNKIVLFNIVLFVLIIGLSYYINGRTYKASLDFYVINSSFSDGDYENQSTAKLFPSVQELEIIGSISKSHELLETVVNIEQLQAHYGLASKNEAIEQLKINARFAFSKKGKITVSVQDFNNTKAQKIAQQLTNSIYTLFINRSILLKNNKRQDIIKSIAYYSKQKELVLNTQFSNKKLSKDLLEISADSLINYKALKNIQKSSDVEFKELLSIISNIKRLAEIDIRLNSLNDQLNKYEQRIKSLGPDNLFILNNAAPFKKNMDWKENVKTAINFTLVIDIILIGCMLFYKHYQKDIQSFFNANKKG